MADVGGNKHIKKKASIEVKDEPKKRDEGYFLPDIKDYHRIVEGGIERLNDRTASVLAGGKSYEQWCSLVKLCFDASADYSQSPLSVSVTSVELMRLHPVFNKLTFYGVRDFLKECRLVKLRQNQLLYR